jgi:hypothetical protein
MPFRHPDRSHPLTTRIEMEVRERLEEAIDFVCLEALVNARRVAGGPAPVSDNPHDRAEYQAHVRAFLRLLAAELREAEPSRPAAAPVQAEDAQLLAAQVTLARRLPDYWQQFEAVSVRYLAQPAPSGGQGRGMLARLFGRG